MIGDILIDISVGRKSLEIELVVYEIILYSVYLRSEFIAFAGKINIDGEILEGGSGQDA